MRSPVEFDHTATELAGPAFWTELEELRKHGPVTWVETLGGYWAVTSHEHVLRAAQDWETFSSGQGVSLSRPGPEVLPYIVPLEVDPPRQRAYRKAANPHFVPRAVMKHEAAIRDIADELIDGFVASGSADFAAGFARLFPGTVFFRLIVSCTDEEFRQAERSARLISFSSDPEQFAQGATELRAWAAKVIEERSDDGVAGDIVQALKHLGETGEPFADHERHSGLQILAQGGIGTSASVIAVVTRVLGEDQTLQERVRADRSLVPALIEECIRLEPPLSIIFRTATRDVEFGGRQIRAGDKVGIFFGAANRDPAVFDHPHEVDIGRPHNRHVGFGAGPHRCIGSNLARMQIRVAVNRLLDRLPSFSVPEGAEVTYCTGQTRGPASMPLEFTARPSVAS